MIGIKYKLIKTNVVRGVTISLIKLIISVLNKDEVPIKPYFILLFSFSNLIVRCFIGKENLLNYALCVFFLTYFLQFILIVSIWNLFKLPNRSKIESRIQILEYYASEYTAERCFVFTPYLLIALFLILVFCLIKWVMSLLLLVL